MLPSVGRVESIQGEQLSVDCLKAHLRYGDYFILQFI